ncbi:MAG: PPC domain-containing DNA-binding protein [Candidatus Zixiibacteriota bacterium]
MFFKKIPNGYLVRLEKGEEIIESLCILAEREKIPGGFLYGLGAVKDVTLGYFDVANKKYVERDFDNEYEVTSLIGDIYYLEGKAGVHAHVNLSDSDYNLIGGHLFKAIITGTGEFFIHTTTETLIRKKEPSSGLNVLDL